MTYKPQYWAQKTNAKQRNIEWQFTYESWLEWWGEDILNRGQGSGKLVMARLGDTGPYSINNCKKITHNENTIEYNKRRTISESTKEKLSSSNRAVWAKRKQLKENI